MTKQQAIDLGKKYEKIFANAIGMECNVSIDSVLKVGIGSNIIIFGGEWYETPIYIKFCGDYELLKDYIIKLRIAIMKLQAEILLLKMNKQS